MFWLDAARLIVPGLAIIEVDTGKITTLPDVPESAAVSAAGAAWLEGGLHVRTWAGAAKTVAAPPSAGRAWVTWLGDGRILLVDHDVNADVFACSVLDPAGGAWGAATCPNGDFLQLVSLVPGPRGLLAVGSTGEGHPGVVVTRYSPEKGQKDVAMPFSDLYPFGWIDVTFHPDGRSATLVTRCQLADPDGRPCLGIDGDEQEWPTNAYEWTIGAPTVRLVAVGLPEGAVVDPTGTRFAVATAGEVRVSALDGEGDASFRIQGLR